MKGRIKRLRRQARLRFNLFEPVRILPFRSYGTATRIFLIGRVLEEDGIVRVQRGDDLQADIRHSIWQNLKDSWRRLRSEEIPGAHLRATIGRQRVELVSDDEGYFHQAVDLDEGLEPGWHEVTFELLESMAGAGARASGEVLVPPEDAEFGVISDLDDTVLRTGVSHRLRLIRTVLFKSAHTRIPFPGVAAFYRALKLGREGTATNPVFYVSNGPWSIYDLYEAFFTIQDIPRGPILLRDIALFEPGSRALRPGQDKLTRIRRLLALYPHMQFVLIGDSSERDPEIYAQIVDEHPGRVRAIYIHDVTARRRQRELRALAATVREHDVPMLLAEDTAAAAAHAIQLGLIAPGALSEVQQRKEEERAPSFRSTERNR